MKLKSESQPNSNATVTDCPQEKSVIDRCLISQLQATRLASVSRGDKTDRPCCLVPVLLAATQSRCNVDVRSTPSLWTPADLSVHINDHRRYHPLQNLEQYTAGRSGVIFTIRAKTVLHSLENIWFFFRKNLIFSWKMMCCIGHVHALFLVTVPSVPATDRTDLTERHL